MVALSVSTSAITSPAETLSPSLTFHLMMVPASIVSESRGMVMGMGMREIVMRSEAGGHRSRMASGSEDLGVIRYRPNRLNNLARVGQKLLLQVVCIRRRHIIAMYAPNVVIQMIETRA